LAEIGYDAEWNCIPASALGAPHIRDRVWIVAYPREVRRNAWRPEQSLQGAGVDGEALLGHANRPRLEGLWRLLERAGEWSAWADGEAEQGGRLVKSGLPLLANGVPDRMERIASTGNAVVPQIPEIIGRAILAAEAA
jgi:DNA (cytosine-5)-methyltransferase 1